MLSRTAEATAVPTDGTWFCFFFGETGSFAEADPDCDLDEFYDPAPAPPWTFTAGASGASFTVADCCNSGDQFEVFDFGVSIGVTPIVDTNSGCGLPDDCNSNPAVSHRTYFLAPGPHSITIQVINSPFGEGQGFFKVESNPVPPTPAACAGMTFDKIIVGTEGNDTINGTGLRELIFGLGGNDTISGGAGNDCVVGGEGSDKLSGGSGNDKLLGEAGNDTLNGDSGTDSAIGGANTDACNAESETSCES